MGVAGLWDILKPAAKARSLTELAVTEGFEANPQGLRGYRIGIDASIWFFHAEYGKEGENPVLRTLFFRCATLMRAPFLPLFVFDGPKRPDFKRGKRINKAGSKLIPGMKRILEAFGFEWRTAPGEAEAELAYLNRIGVIDGILSDDVDNFLFGGMTVIRNQSNNLSGNKANPVLNSEGKDDKNHTRIYRFQDIQNHPDIQLTRGGMILIGLMSGGDYEQGGLERCGIATAHALARCGFGDTLYEAALKLPSKDLAIFLDNWRQELRHELKTNSRGFMTRKSIALSKSIPETFPNIDVLLSYVEPITSESLGHEGANPKITWSREPSVASLASCCELFFEWGYREAIVKRFRTVIWPGVVLRVLRRAVLDLDNLSPSPSTPQKSHRKNITDAELNDTPSKIIARQLSAIGLESDHESSSNEPSGSGQRFFVKISRERSHASTDSIPEYRLEVAPAQLVEEAESGLKGLRSPEGPGEWSSDDSEEDEEQGKRGKSKVVVAPTSHLRLWMPTCMVDPVEKKLVREFRDVQDRKKQKKAPKKKVATPKAKAKTRSPAHKIAVGLDPVVHNPAFHSTSQTQTALYDQIPRSKSHSLEATREEEEESSGDELPTVKNTIVTSIKDTFTSADSCGSLLSSRKPTGIKRPVFRSSSSPSSSLSKPLISDSEDELPADVYQAVWSTKTAITHTRSVMTTGYISLSDDDNFPRVSALPKPPVRSRASNKRPSSQTTIDGFFEHAAGGIPAKSQTASDTRLQKSPRKTKAQQSPRRHVEKVVNKVPMTSTLALTDEDSDIGYSGVQQPKIPPLQLARARARATGKKAVAVASRPRLGVSESDIIDLT